MDGEGEEKQQLEFESCRRVAANQPLWQQAWASTLLTTATAAAAAGGATELTPGSVEAHSDILKSGGELWTEKYRPTQGADVLGNRANTEYLTQWLKGLEVSGWTLNPEESSSTAAGTLSATAVGGGGGGAGSAGIGGVGSMRKASDIMGTAKKRRKRPRRRGASDLDDFIIYDAEDFEDPYGYGCGYVSEEDDGCFAAPRPLSTFSRLAHHHGPSPDGDVVNSNILGGINHSGRIKTSPKLFEIKSNTVLLSGPTGSGKTAAVYACAEESGYEVFEVSPGMRRTGKEVLGLVGEMAENHHVHVVPGKMDISSKEDIQGIMNGKSHDSPASTPAPAPAPAPAQTPMMHSFFQQVPRGPKSGPEWKQHQQQPQQPQQSKDEDESMDDCSDVDVDGSDDYSSPPAAQSNNINPPPRTRSLSSEGERDGSHACQEDTLSDLYSLLATTNPRQSLILLEEVDILFEEDKGFWASIVTLLSKSRRPVVMTCNDTSKIPTATLRFQEHLEFTRSNLRELFQYLTCICKIEGYMCSSEYILGLIQYCQYDVRRCLMQLQYDAGLVRTKHTTTTTLSRSSSSSSLSSSSGGSFGRNSRRSSGGPSALDSSAGGSRNLGNGGTGAGVGAAVGSPGRKKQQRLLRISAKGIIPATAPTISQERGNGGGGGGVKSPVQELEQLEVQMQYAEMMSLWDSELRMKPGRVIQCYELDQFEASKDDIVGQHFSIYKRPSGADHLLLDQEIAGLVEEGCESLYVNLANQYGMAEAHVFEDAVKKDDPIRDLAENFVPLNEIMSR
ncbi:hypothetical protein BGZ58_001767 [Dissophora ornata]|nr:hypothetical protein BGZ58_001767 [Dissophora ornata]